MSRPRVRLPNRDGLVETVALECLAQNITKDAHKLFIVRIKNSSYCSQIDRSIESLLFSFNITNQRTMDIKNDINVTSNSDLDEEDDSKIFPQRLMGILSDELNQEAICWLPHGRSFIVRNRKLFAELVMPRYFSRKAKYSSFTRKLNRWYVIDTSNRLAGLISMDALLNFCFLTSQEFHSSFEWP